jgi:hypothetical protein
MHFAARLGERSTVRIVQNDVEAGSQGRLCDTGTHRAGADDAYGVEWLRVV